MFRDGGIARFLRVELETEQAFATRYCGSRFVKGPTMKEFDVREESLNYHLLPAKNWARSP